MNKSEFVAAIINKTGFKKKEVELTLNAFWDVVTEQLAQGDTISFVGTGTFTTKKRPARTGRDPKTGKAINIEAKTVPQFKAGTKLKAAVDKA
jgi:DNA-binding protein HU-beta